MSESRPIITIDANRCIDVYDVTGISVGVKIIIQNVGASPARLYESSAEPTAESGYNIIEENKYLESGDTPVGIWAASARGTMLQVEVA